MLWMIRLDDTLHQFHLSITMDLIRIDSVNRRSLGKSINMRVFIHFFRNYLKIRIFSQRLGQHLEIPTFSKNLRLKFENCFLSMRLLLFGKVSVFTLRLSLFQLKNHTFFFAFFDLFKEWLKDAIWKNDRRHHVISPIFMFFIDYW